MMRSCSTFTPFMASASNQDRTARTHLHFACVTGAGFLACASGVMTRLPIPPERIIFLGSTLLQQLLILIAILETLFAAQ